MGYRLVAEGTFSERLISLAAGDQGYILDRGVFEDYAARLLPRAIGYSAGLIDYFFRGKVFARGSLVARTTEGNLLLAGIDVENVGSETMRGDFEFHAFTGEQQQRIAAFRGVTLGPEEPTLLCLPEAFGSAVEERCTFPAEVVASSPTLLECPSNRRFTIAFSGELGEETEAVTGLFFEECFPSVE